MKIKTLIARLKKLEAKHPNDLVSVDKTSLFDGNGTYEICDVKDVEHKIVREVDGDGFTIINADGFERTRSCIVLKG